MYNTIQHNINVTPCNTILNKYTHTTKHNPTQHNPTHVTTDKHHNKQCNQIQHIYNNNNTIQYHMVHCDAIHHHTSTTPHNQIQQ